MAGSELVSLSVQQKAVQTGLAPYIRDSKHNRYCGGLLIRSPIDFGVQVQVLPVPPKEKGEAVVVRIAKDGFLICPKCGRKTKVKVKPGTTRLIRFPLYCFWCREEFEIDYK